MVPPPSPPIASTGKSCCLPPLRPQSIQSAMQAFFPVVRIGSPPHPPGSVAPPLFGTKGETHSIAGEGVGAPNSDEGTDTPVLQVYYNSSTSKTFKEREDRYSNCHYKVMERGWEGGGGQTQEHQKKEWPYFYFYCICSIE